MKSKKCILFILLLFTTISFSSCGDNDNKDILSARNKAKIYEALNKYSSYSLIAVSKEYGSDTSGDYYLVSKKDIQLDDSFLVLTYDKEIIYYSYSCLESIVITTYSTSNRQLTINFNN
jgi:hypothetical protein